MVKNEALEMAQKTLDEIRQYQEIGTIEECKKAMNKQNKIKAKKRWIEEGSVEFFGCRDSDRTFLSDHRYVVM